MRVRKRGYTVFPVAALLISLSGFALFYLIPFLVSAVYAFVDNPIQMNYVGFQNFIDLASNEFFMRGMKNTLIFMGCAIPLCMLCSLFLAILLKKLGKWGGLISVLFLIPLVMPSATIVRFLMDIFGPHGGLNEAISLVKPTEILWMETGYMRGIMVLLFVWKYLGYNTVLFLTGLYGIPEEYYQCAAVFGADKRQQFFQVTLVYLTPGFFLVFIMSFVNSFKIFREIYLLQGDNPTKCIYLLQHFVNNTLLSMNYQRLVSAVYVLTLLIGLVVMVTFRLERKISENLKA